ncbi:hypothetical protein ColLi_04303 [Colletotrichum liriopes]|uniref:Uncharacterized protein n=1 Tax=Colletotrichum liriopes TaxID=708192 RepID=A0AA37GIW0_9PEZI|nr:hypothetical protein ColLi_04303 [Colletotrichum liriopes]
MVVEPAGAVVEGAVHVPAGPLDVGPGEARRHLCPDGGHLGLLFPDLALLLLDAALLVQGGVVAHGMRAEDVGQAVLLAQQGRFGLDGAAAQHHLALAGLALGLQSLSALAEGLLSLHGLGLLLLALVLGLLVGVAELGEDLGRERSADGTGVGEVVVVGFVLGPEATHALAERLALDGIVVRLFLGPHALGRRHLVEAKLAQPSVQGEVAPLLGQSPRRLLAVQAGAAGTQGLVLFQVAALHQTQRAVPLGDVRLACVQHAERDVVFVGAAVFLLGPFFPGESNLLLLAVPLLRLGNRVELDESGVHAVLADVAVRVLRAHPRVVLAQLQLGEQGGGGPVENTGELVRLLLRLFFVRALAFGLVDPVAVDVIRQGLVLFSAAGHRAPPGSVVRRLPERHEAALLSLRGRPDVLLGQQDGGRGRLAVLPVGAVHLGAELAGKGVVCEGADGCVRGRVEDAVERSHGGAFLDLDFGRRGGQVEKGARAQLRWQLRSPRHFGLAALLGRREGGGCGMSSDCPPASNESLCSDGTCESTAGSFDDASPEGWPSAPSPNVVMPWPASGSGSHILDSRTGGASGSCGRYSALPNPGWPMACSTFECLALRTSALGFLDSLGGRLSIAGTRAG